VHNELESSASVRRAEDLVSVVKGLIAANIKDVPKTLSGLIRREPVSLKFILVELEFETRGMKVGPVDHPSILSVAIASLKRVEEWGKAPSPLPSPAGRGGRRSEKVGSSVYCGILPTLVKLIFL
jgi:hypothetical protein